MENAIYFYCVNDFLLLPISSYLDECMHYQISKHTSHFKQATIFAKMKFILK